jgi:chromosome partitioning protein
MGVQALPYIVLRNDHQDALGAGLAVTEFALNGKSAGEMRDLWQWVAKKLALGSPAFVAPEFRAAS